MMIFTLTSSVNSTDGLSSVCPLSFLDESKLDAPSIIGGDDQQTVQFSLLLDKLKHYSSESSDLLILSIKAVTPRFGEDNAYQVTISSGTLILYLAEINEEMKDFLYQYVFDINGYIKMGFPALCTSLNSLWNNFPEENPVAVLKDDKVPCSPYIMPVLEKKNYFDEKSMTLDEVLNFKKTQSAFKHQLHIIHNSLNVLNSPEAMEHFKEKKMGELVLQTGVHTGLSIAGSVLGAVIGTAIAPGPGTLIGAGIGIGISWLGKKAYDYCAGVVSNRINPNPHLKTQEIDREIKSAEKGKVWWCGAEIKSFCVNPSRAASTLGSGLVSSLIEGVSLPLHDIATACYDYEKAYEGLTPEKASKIETLLNKYHRKLNEKNEQVLDYLEANPTPDNLRRRKKILERDVVIRKRIAIIRESIKDAVESRSKSIHLNYGPPETMGQDPANTIHPEVDCW